MSQTTPANSDLNAQDVSAIARNFQAGANCLQGKVILVTGAGAGIGREAAKCFASHGATVVLLSKTIETLESLYDEICENGDPEPAIYPMHLAGAVEKDYQDLHDVLAKEFGRLDGLLHNASMLGERRSIAQSSWETWNELMQVNVNAEFLLTKALLPLLEQSEAGSIVFTSSSVGRKGRAYWGAYAVSKFATEGLMQVLAEELASTTNITVNSINPGGTRTDMRKKAYPMENPEQVTPPAQLMSSYLFLISQAKLAENQVPVTGLALDAQAPKG